MKAKNWIRSIAISTLVISMAPAFAELSYCPALSMDLRRPDSKVGALAIAYLSAHLKTYLDEAVSAEKFQFMPYRADGPQLWKQYPKGRFDHLDPSMRIAIDDLLAFAQLNHRISEPWTYFLIHHAYDAIGESVLKEGMFTYPQLMSDLSGNLVLAGIHRDDPYLVAYRNSMPRYAAVIEGSASLSTEERVKATEDIVDLMLGQPIMLLRDQTLSERLPAFIAQNVDLIKQAKPAYTDDDIVLLKLIAKSYASPQ